MRTAKKKRAKKAVTAAAPPIHISITPGPQPAFWLVWCDRYNSTPHRKHELSESAKAEAERLARDNPGQKFYVLPATKYAIADITPVEWKIADSPLPQLPEEEVPF